MPIISRPRRNRAKLLLNFWKSRNAARKNSSTLSTISILLSRPFTPIWQNQASTHWVATLTWLWMIPRSPLRVGWNSMLCRQWNVFGTCISSVGVRRLWLLWLFCLLSIRTIRPLSLSWTKLMLRWTTVSYFLYFRFRLIFAVLNYFLFWYDEWLLFLTLS